MHLTDLDICYTAKASFNSVQDEELEVSKEQLNITTERGWLSFAIFCFTFLECSNCRWTDTAASMQYQWKRNFVKKTKQNFATVGQPRS